MSNVITSTKLLQICPLWHHLFGDLDGYIGMFSGLRTAPGTKYLAQPEERYFAWPDEAEPALEWALVESESSREAYFCAHLLTGTRRIKEHAASILALWVDGDGAKVPADIPQPTAIVESSPGREHYYWRLTRPISPREAELLNKRLTYAIGGDKGKWATTSLLRVPETRNFKYEDAPTIRLVEVRDAA